MKKTHRLIGKTIYILFRNVTNTNTIPNPPPIKNIKKLEEMIKSTNTTLIKHEKIIEDITKKISEKDKTKDEITTLHNYINMIKQGNNELHGSIEYIKTKILSFDSDISAQAELTQINKYINKYLT